MKTTPLHDRFGVDVHDVDLRQVTATSGYPEIRRAFEAHSLLLFRNQDLDDASHLSFGELFGPIENRSKGKIVEPRMSTVTNVRADDTVAPEQDKQVLNLKANQLWHTDSTFLPVPALANIITARVVPSKGGETELASTRAAWQDMPEALKTQVRDKVLHHRYAHSRAKVSSDLADQALFTMWRDQTWRALWRNPVNGEDALYIASHAFAVEGLGDAEGEALIAELIDWCTQDTYVYTHRWQPGDVLIWDERATLHRGMPWPYEEPRTLASICISARDVDGLDDVRPAA
ncbi:MAG: TauD/TfdA family dioxygenase [Pseudomonadota bacterium]